MRNTILLFLVNLITLISCNKEEVETSKKEQLLAFNSVILNDNFSVILEEDSLYSLEITGYEDIKNVTYTIVDSILMIENTKRFKWTKPRKNKIELIIKAPEFKEITANEACTITNEKPIKSHHFGLIFNGKANEANLKLDNSIFYYWNNFPCGGKLTLSGKTEVLKLWNYALVSIDAKYLSADYGIVENSSQGNIDLNVEVRLEYGIHGKGNINLYRIPQLIINNGESNSGTLVYK